MLGVSLRSYVIVHKNRLCDKNDERRATSFDDQVSEKEVRWRIVDLIPPSRFLIYCSYIRQSPFLTHNYTIPQSSFLASTKFTQKSKNKQMLHLFYNL
jgi:hypothetical protein